MEIVLVFDTPPAPLSNALALATEGRFSSKQKPTACGGGYVQLAMPVIPVESRFQAGRRTGIQFR